MGGDWRAQRGAKFPGDMTREQATKAWGAFAAFVGAKGFDVPGFRSLRETVQAHWQYEMDAVGNPSPASRYCCCPQCSRC